MMTTTLPQAENQDTDFTINTPIADLCRYWWAHDHNIEQSMIALKRDLIINFSPSGEYRHVEIPLGDPESTLSLVMHDSGTEWLINFDRGGDWEMTPANVRDLAEQLLRANDLAAELNAAVI